jgi:hypothetical protein
MLKKICTIFLFSLITFTGLFGTLTPQAAAQTQTTPAQTQTTQQSGSATRQAGSQSSVCDGLSWQVFSCPVASLVELTMGFFGKMVFYTGVFFNYSVEITIIRMADVIKHMPAVEVGWKALRDLGNIAFIFILIYIAVITILGWKDSGQWKQLVLNVVIIALLVNFSLFLTKVTIDASNLLSLQFYNAIASPGTLADKNAGLSWVFFNATRLSTLYAPQGLNGGSFTAVTQNQLNPQIRLGANNSLNNIILVGLMGSIFFLITSFVFLATGILLVSRFVSLVFILITSGIAAVMYILPSTRGLFDSWLKRLINQLIFAPVLMIMLWLVAYIINGTCTTYAANGSCIAGNQSFIEAVLTSGNQPLGIQATATIADTLVSGVPGTVFLILNFVILMAFMIAALVVSREAGHMSSGFATKWAGKLTFGTAGFVGRNTVGRLSSRIARSEVVKNWATNSKIGIGTIPLRATKSVAGSNFDFRTSRLGQLGADVANIDAGKAQEGGYTESVEKRAKAQQAFAKDLGKGVIINDPAVASLVKDLEEQSKKDSETVKKHNEELASLERQKAEKLTSDATVQAKKKTADEATTNLEKAKQEFEKAQNNAAPESTLATLKSNLDTAKSAHDTAQKNYTETAEEVTKDISEKVKSTELEKYKIMKRQEDASKRIKTLNEAYGKTREETYLRGGKTIWSTLSGTKPIIEKNLKESAEKDKKKEDEKFTKRMKAVAKDAEAKENKEAAERKTAEQQADAVELQKLEGIGTIDAITKRKEIEDRMKKRAEEINNLTKKARTAEKEAERARNTIEVTATATVEGGGGGAKKEEGH